MVHFVLSYKSPFCLETTIISSHLTVSQSTSYHQHPIFVCTVSTGTAFINHKRWEGCSLRLPWTAVGQIPYRGIQRTRNKNWSFIAPRALLMGWASTAKLGSPSHSRMDVLCMMWPLPASPMAQIPGRASLPFGEGIAFLLDRQQLQFESLT